MIDHKSAAPDDLWYLVGLITADGCLSSDGRHTDITAKDKDFLQELGARLKISNAIGQKKNGMGLVYRRIQIGGIESIAICRLSAWFHRSHYCSIGSILMKNISNIFLEE